MHTREIKYGLFLLFLLISLNGLCQKKDFSLEIFSGPFGYQPKDIIYQHTSDLDLEGKLFGFGGNYTFGFSKREHFYWETGALFVSKSQYDYRTQHLQFPLNFNFQWGEKIRFSSGIGIYGALLVSDKGWELIDSYQENRETAQLGISGRIGMGFYALDKHLFYFSLQAQSDLSRLYRQQEEQFGMNKPHVMSTIAGVHWGLCLKYVIPNNKGNE